MISEKPLLERIEQAARADRRPDPRAYGRSFTTFSSFLSRSGWRTIRGRSSPSLRRDGCASQRTRQRPPTVRMGVDVARSGWRSRCAAWQPARSRSSADRRRPAGERARRWEEGSGRRAASSSGQSPGARSVRLLSLSWGDHAGAKRARRCRGDQVARARAQPVPPTVRPSMRSVGWPTPTGTLWPSLPHMPTPGRAPCRCRSSRRA